MKKCLVVLTLCSLLLIFSCTKTLIIKDESLITHRLARGDSFTAPVNGWFMSDEAIIKLLNTLEDLKAELEKCRLEKDK